MNSDYERELEQQIDRELKCLPDLDAPSVLVRRVMLAIERRRSLRWYNQPWQNWPLALRFAALALLSVMFGGLCIASWQLTRAAGMSAAMQEVGGLFSGLTTIWNTINVLLGAVLLVMKHLGTWFLVGVVTFAAISYALCVGLGTAWLRLALARR